MVRMKCIRAHSSLVWGSPSDGEIFEVDPGYVDQLESNGLAVRVDPEPVDNTGAIAALQATVTKPASKRGRPRKVRK